MTDKLKGGRGPVALSTAEEKQLVSYMIYMGERGTPIGRKDVKALAFQIDQVHNIAQVILVIFYKLYYLNYSI